jgi:hypothetical protein
MQVGWTDTVRGTRRCGQFEKLAGPNLKFSQYSGARLDRREQRARTILQLVVLTGFGTIAGFFLRELLSLLFR